MAISTNLLVYFRCSDQYSTVGNFTASYSSVSVTSSGKYGDGWAYAAASAAATVSSNIQVTGSDGYAVSFWAYDLGRDVTSADKAAIAARGFDGALLYSLVAYGSERWFGYRTDGGTEIYFDATASSGTGPNTGGTRYAPNISDFNDVWTHVAVSVANQTASLYINNSLVATSSNSNWDDDHAFDTLGNMQSGFFGRTALASTLDEIAFWNRSLSSSEITQIYGSEINSLLSGGGSSVSKQRSAQLRAETQLNNATSSAGGDGFLLKADGTVRVASEFTVNKPRNLVYAGYIAERLNAVVGVADSLSGSIAFSGTNYIDAATDITGALKLLDASISSAEGVNPVTGSAGGRDLVKLSRSATVDAYATKAADAAALNRYYAGFTSSVNLAAFQSGSPQLAISAGLVTSSLTTIAKRFDYLQASGSQFTGVVPFGGADLIGIVSYSGVASSPGSTVAAFPYTTAAGPLGWSIGQLVTTIADLQQKDGNASVGGLAGDLGVGHGAFTATHNSGYDLASGSTGVAIDAALTRIDNLFPTNDPSLGSALVGHDADSSVTGSFVLSDGTVRATLTALNNRFGILQSELVSEGSALVGFSALAQGASMVAGVSKGTVKEAIDATATYLYTNAGNASLVRKADHLKVQYVTTGAVGAQYDLALGADIHDSASVQVFVNGLLQRHGGANDWVMSGTNTVRFKKGLESGDFLVVQFLRDRKSVV